MRLSQLVSGFTVIPPGADPEIVGLSEDSRRIERGMLFVAVPGTALDGHAYIGDAVARGAAAIVAERTGAIPAGMPAVRVPSSRDALALLAARHFRTTSTPLSLLGFTGTFGKTSTSDILRRLLDAAGQQTGVLGSLGARYKSFYDPGEGLTTPAPVELHRALRGLADAGATTVILEVTSHALRLGRVKGLRFDGGLLAAIMPGEHTDFHRSYEDYVEAKRLFLAELEPAAVLAYDADNLAARRMVTEPGRGAARARESGDGHRRAPAAATAPASTQGHSIGFSLEGRDADVQLYDILLDRKGATFSLGGRALTTQSGTRVSSPLLGRGHLRNVALAITYAIGIGLPATTVREVVATLTPLRRRMERYEVDGRTVLDDTAAHPDSLAATFDVAAVLPHRALAVVYAIRGRRGPDINRRIATALADLSVLHGSEALIVTSAAERVSALDMPTAEEVDVTRQALVARGRRFVWHDGLGDAIRDAYARTKAGDLILLVGAQGMNDGKTLLGAATG
jgi:UDP-N-acetylmuramoyl-L-alanyl-D-glutamate--2,6-diaminopimelate ligase